MTEGMLKEARATLRIRHRLRRNAYHDERYKAWAQKRVNFIGKLLKEFNTRSEFGVPEGYTKMYSGLSKVSGPTKAQQSLRISRAKERLVAVSQKRSGDSKDFTSIRINLLVQLASGETFDSLLAYKGNTLGGRARHQRKLEEARTDEPLGGPSLAIMEEKLQASFQQNKGKKVRKSHETERPLPRRLGSLANYEVKTRARKAKAPLQPCRFCGSTKLGRHTAECKALRTLT